MSAVVLAVGRPSASKVAVVLVWWVSPVTASVTWGPVWAVWRPSWSYS